MIVFRVATFNINDIRSRLGALGVASCRSGLYGHRRWPVNISKGI